jgi:hypothetical protein
MKKLVYFVLLLPILLSFHENEVSIVGKWRIDKYIEKLSVSTGQIVIDTTKGSRVDYFMFLDDGTMYTHFYYSLMVNYDTEHKNVFMGARAEDKDYSSDTGSYKVSDKMLILSKGGLSDTSMHIQKLTDHELILYWRSKDSLDPKVTYNQESWRIFSR